MYGHDENVHLQSRLSESFTYLENPAHLGFRNRGGSDDGQNSAGNTEDKQKSVQHIYEESRSVKYHRNCIFKKCACCSRIQESRGRRENQNSQHVDVCHEPSVTTDRQTILADVSDVSCSNPPYREPQSSVSVPENYRQEKMSEQMRSCKKMEAFENSKCVDDAEIERNLTSEIVEIAHATRVLSTDSMVHSRNNPDEPIASTSKWETPLVLSRKTRKNLGSRFCTTTMKSWRKRPIVNNKIKAPFKRRRNVRTKKPSRVTIHESEMKITQIEPSTVQTDARESNKRRNNINVRLQTPDTIVAKILSEFLVSGEMKKRVLMSITLESDSDHDILDTKEVEAQTSFSNITFTEIDVFRTDCYSDGPPQATNVIT